MNNLPTTRARLHAGRPGAAAQRGATLFAALMILIVLTLLALSAAQVTGLQERMAGVYRADNDAFHAAEQTLRKTEREVLDDARYCDGVPSDTLPSSWNNGTVDFTDTTGAAYVKVENLEYSGTESDVSRGIDFQGSASLNVDRQVGGVGCLIFRISSVRPDRQADPTSRAIVQSIYIP